MVTAGYAVAGTSAVAKDVAAMPWHHRWHSQRPLPAARQRHVYTTLHRWSTDVHIGGQAQATHTPALPQTYHVRLEGLPLAVDGIGQGAYHAGPLMCARYVPSRSLTLFAPLGMSHVYYRDYVLDVLEPDDAEVLALI